MALNRLKVLATGGLTAGAVLVGAFALARQEPGPERGPAAAPRAGAGEPADRGPRTPAPEEKEAPVPKVDPGRAADRLARDQAELDIDAVTLAAKKNALRQSIQELEGLRTTDPDGVLGPEKLDAALAREEKHVLSLRDEVLHLSEQLDRKQRELAMVAKPGDRLFVHVLQALPGRPLGGSFLVRPDGTIALSYYGDLAVIGLTPRQIKVRVVEHLRKFLDDETLGLVRAKPKPGGTSGKTAIDPAEVDSVAVDLEPDRPVTPSGHSLEDVARKLDQVLLELESLKRRIHP